MPRGKAVDYKTVRGIVTKLERFEKDAEEAEQFDQADAFADAYTALEPVASKLKQAERTARRNGTGTSGQ